MDNDDATAPTDDQGITQPTVSNTPNPTAPAPPGSTIVVPPGDGEPEGGAGE